MPHLPPSLAIARFTFAALIATLAISGATAASSPLPRLVERAGRHALLVDDAPFFMLGGQCNNSSGWPATLPRVWEAIAEMHANTLEIPLYWQQIEPREGAFDFSVVDTILAQAREHRVRLVLLWFATWKNGNTDYTPDWVKLNPTKYPHLVNREGHTLLSASPHAKTTLDADAKAFAAVMRHLKEFDPQRTVIMVQVENEPGTYGSPRDFSPVAQKLFENPVPAELLKPEVLRELNKPADAKGSWSQVFGSDADEFFHAWSIARYINHVAEAGQAVNPLPMYVNVALEGEAGGAMHEVIPIYKAAAPAIAILGPDVYQSPEKAMKTIASYDRPDNPLFVPETFGNPDYLYEVVRRGGIGFSPFGIDHSMMALDSGNAPKSRLSPIATQYALLRLADKHFAQWLFEDRVRVAKVSADDPKQTIDLAGWQATIWFGPGRRFGGPPEVAPAPPAPPAGTPAPATGFGAPPKPSGRAVIAQLGDNEFVVMATQCRVTFDVSGPNKGKLWQFLKVEEGHYEGDAFKFLRLRNGDEIGWATVTVGEEPVLFHITMAPL